MHSLGGLIMHFGSDCIIIFRDRSDVGTPPPPFLHPMGSVERVAMCPVGTCLVPLGHRGFQVAPQMDTGP